MDFISRLPVEITEKIISYLDGNDILKCCQVSREWWNVFQDDRTWLILCNQKGWSKDVESDIEAKKWRWRWRDHYWLNHNWTTGKYRHWHRRVMSQGGGLQLNLNGQYVITSHLLGVQIWNFDNDPLTMTSFHQNIYCNDDHLQTYVWNRNIVIKFKDCIRVFLQDKRNKFYKLIKTISTVNDSNDYDPDVNLKCAAMQIGCGRLAIVQKENKIHKILLWNLYDGHKYKSKFLQDNVKHVFKIILFNNYLYLVTLNQNEYRIKIDNLCNDKLSTEIVAFKNVAFGVIPPELQVNEKFIVAFCPTDIGHDLRYSYSPLKVWDSTGNVVNFIILDSGRIDYFAFCLINDIVVYRCSESQIKVWQPITNKEMCCFNTEPKICKIDKSVGSLFVLSYEYYFDVCDYKRGLKLYRVMYADDSYSVIDGRIEINKYYYAKQDRNKKTVTVYSFRNIHDGIDCDNRFISVEYTNNCKMLFDHPKDVT